jgi:four helix bundle protein
MSRIQGDLKERTLAFGQRVLELVRELPHEPRGWVVSKQIGKSGTSVGANVWEADHALTDADFAHKISLARKESSETEFWLNLIIRAELMPKSRCEPSLKEARELTMILGATVARLQRKNQRSR